MNKPFKTLSLLIAIAFAAPVIAVEPNKVQTGDVVGTIGGETVQVTDEQNPAATSADLKKEPTRDYKKEDAANTKLALASSGMIISASWGIATGIATKSALAGCVLGGPLFVVPATVYCYLRNKYKNTFDEKAYKRVCDTEDKTFLYTMSTLVAPAAAILYGGLAYTALQASGLLGYGIGGITGTALGKVATALGITKETATIATIGLTSAAPTILETKTELEKQKLEHEKHGSNYTPNISEKIGYFIPKYCKNFAYAYALLSAVSFAQAQYKG